MLLFALHLITAIRIILRAKETAVVAYAYKITTFVTLAEDVPAICDAIRCYEMATGASLDVGKSKVMSIGSWDTTTNVLDFSYYSDTKIQGFSMTNTVGHSGTRLWRPSPARYEPWQEKVMVWKYASRNIYVSCNRTC
jgi:hypothetical protein